MRYGLIAVIDKSYYVNYVAILDDFSSIGQSMGYQMQ